MSRALAQTAGQPTEWGMSFQGSATALMDQLVNFHSLLLWIIIAITLFVLGLMIYVAIRFRAAANPKPSKTTHNTLVEIIWTAVPILILVLIAIPSMKLLYAQEQIPETDMTVKVTGSQWYWNYQLENPGKGSFSFDSYMLDDEEAKAAGLPRLLGVDNPLVLPVDTSVRVLLTASDVIHAFALPSFGVKKDAVPGRLNELWISPIREEGIYYGQCSEICGTGHSFMPIMIKVVSKAEYQQWLDSAYEEFAAVEAPEAAVQLADASKSR
jgi:cytochrome c oxidase subunit 2|tara:strand:- start:771 stop:1577 length:807 start_codon:yes stop_codon:yes gene_type:complete